MKKVLGKLFVLISLSLIFVNFPMDVSGAGKAIELKCLGAWPLHIPQNYHYHKYIEVVNQKAQESGIPLTLVKTGGPEVVGTRDQFKAMRSGVVDIVYTAGGYFLGETVELSALACIKPDPNRQSEALRNTKVLDVIAKACGEKSKCIPLGYLLAGGAGYTLLSTKSVNGADWSGLKVRSIGKQTAMGIEALGGSVATMPGGEVFQALQRGVVDAVTGAPFDRWGFGERGVYKYIVAPPIFGSSSYMFISVRTWSTLPDNVKSLLKGVAEDLQNKGLFLCNEWDEEAAQKFVKEGVKILQLSPEDEKKVAKAFRFDYLNYLRKSSPKYGPRIFDLLKDYVY